MTQSKQLDPNCDRLNCDCQTNGQKPNKRHVKLHPARVSGQTLNSVASETRLNCFSRVRGAFRFTG